MINIKEIKHSDTVILANGSFPTHCIPLAALKNAKKLICCDGAINNLLQSGIEPSLIIGDLDSISEKVKKKYMSIIIQDPDQNTNDLTKAVNWCKHNQIHEITIVGATGKREDHTLGNISLLSNYIKDISVSMLTDTGFFTPILKSTTFQSYEGQQVSVFSQTANLEIDSVNLKYPLNKLQLPYLWMGTLNECVSDNFTISIESGDVIVFQEY